MRATVITLGLIFVVLTAVYFTISPQMVLGQPINIRAVFNDHMRSFEHANNLAELPIALVEKAIPAGHDFVAFNPNRGDAKVITVLAPIN